jgi:hypothetical protein
VSDPHIFGHTYGGGAVRHFLRLVLEAACSFRGASAVMGLSSDFGPQFARRPAANTGQMWLLQVGLYELQRPKEAADDWVWILDHTVQLGTVKCLLIVGCRLSVWRAAGRPLQHRELSVMALEPVQKSDGAVVARQLEAATAKTGIVPRAILSDQGSDLKTGISSYRCEHPETVATLDIAHQAANQLKRELNADERWMKFVVTAGQAKQRLALTPLAALVPPTLRSKARYMNLEELVAWGLNTLRYLDNPQPLAGRPVDRVALAEKLGWLAEYRSALAEWGAMMTVISTTLVYVRANGYHHGAAEELGPCLLPAASAIAHRVAERLLEFVASQSAVAVPGERLMGSSECLESLIGKGKRLEGQQSKSGFTKMILGLAASVVTPTCDFVKEALTQTKNQDVLDWCRARLGISVTAQRRAAYASPVGTKPG